MKVKNICPSQELFIGGNLFMQPVMLLKDRWWLKSDGFKILNWKYTLIMKGIIWYKLSYKWSDFILASQLVYLSIYFIVAILLLYVQPIFLRNVDQSTFLLSLFRLVEPRLIWSTTLFNRLYSIQNSMRNIMTIL